MRSTINPLSISARADMIVHQLFPDAEVRVKPMQTNSLNSDASKSDREKLNRMPEEMFEESDYWLNNI
ncbi:MsgA [Enterobacter hormaechei subsp. steigerwaltii]|nr:MsgA [Enterobacter hormaechei subsp. steigerwaltii]